MDNLNKINTKIFANTKQVKSDLLAQLELRRLNYENRLPNLNTQKEIREEVNLYKGFKQGIEYAIKMIEYFENTPEGLKDK